MPEPIAIDSTEAALILVRRLQEENMRLFLALDNLAMACRSVEMPPLAAATLREAEDLLRRLK